MLYTHKSVFGPLNSKISFKYAHRRLRSVEVDSAFLFNGKISRKGQVVSDSVPLV